MTPLLFFCAGAIATAVWRVARGSAMPARLDASYNACMEAAGPDDNREIWDAAWRARLNRSLPRGCLLDLGLLKSGLPTHVTIAANPVEFASRGYRESDICPVCGKTTAGLPRVAASLDIAFEMPVAWPSGGVSAWAKPLFSRLRRSRPARPRLSLGAGVWAHAACLEACPVVGPAASSPW